MFKNPLFRHEALVRNAQPEPLDGLLRVTAPHEWLLLAGLFVALLAAVAWSVLASLELTVSGAGVMMRPGERHAVVATVSGVVAEVAVRVGDRVEAGETIARLELPELDRRLRTARARLEVLEERAGSGKVPAGSWLETELAAARAETVELTAQATAGAVLVSPHGGEVSARNLVVGQLVRAGTLVAEVRTGDHRAHEAIVLTANAPGRQVEVGMEARVSVPGGSGPPILTGNVIDAVSGSAAVPDWLARSGLVTPDSAASATHAIRVAVSGDGAARIPDRVPCLVEIVVDRRSPLGLLVSLAGRAG